MDYEAATRYLISLGNEVRASASDALNVSKLGLENIAELLADLGSPQNSYPSILVAGTNGKGSVAAMLDVILRAAGESRGVSVPTEPPFRVGLYTSPHLVEISERIQVDGQPISQPEFAALFDSLRARIERLLAAGTLRFHPTYFECLTAMAMEYFRQKNCSLVVFEVGMGGRLDATNLAAPCLSVITAIDLDHERFLGHTIPAIAAEKAGIIKPGGVVVTTASHPEALRVIREKARQQGARLVDAAAEYRVEGLTSQAGRYCFDAVHADGFRLAVALSLRGRHQVANSLAAIAAARELGRMGFPIAAPDIQRGLASANWPGRLELIHENPMVLIDGAHNPSGARALLEFWQEHFASQRVILVYGAMRDKAVGEIVEILFPAASAVFLTQPDQFRAASPEAIRELGEHLNRNLVCVQDPAAALEAALACAAPGDVIFATGSLFLVADIKRRWPRGIPAGGDTAESISDSAGRAANASRPASASRS